MELIDFARKVLAWGLSDFKTFLLAPIKVNNELIKFTHGHSSPLTITLPELTMQIQINVGHHIDGHEALGTWASGEVKSALGRHSDHITRTEIHLTDEKGLKGGAGDKRCVLEARLVGRPPLVVTEHAENFHQSITGAIDKLNRLIDSTLGRAARTDTYSTVS
jgi:ribosome-associated translation inhibitor RaiA